MVPLSATVAMAEQHVYVPYSGIISGTAGVERVVLRVKNDTGSVMVCSAALAHWYSETLGRVPAGMWLVVDLWHDPETGVINLMNATDDRMPVEAVWCGAADDLTATRTRVPLPLRAGDAPKRLLRHCSAGNDTGWICPAPEPE